MYSWESVGERTEKVYDLVASSSRDDSTYATLVRHYKCGPIFGPLVCCFYMLLKAYIVLLEIVQPAADIEPAFQLCEIQ